MVFHSGNTSGAGAADPRLQAIAEGVRECSQNSQPGAAGFGAAPQYIGEVSRHQAVAEGARDKQRTISVGILVADRVAFSLDGQTVLAATESGGLVVIGGEAREEWYFAAGGQGADCQRLPDNRSRCSKRGDMQKSADTQVFRLQDTPYFTLKNVEIGKGFHWQRYQDQSFPGDLRLIARDGKVIAINVVGIEDYLQCVIASEMSPSAGFEFLKAHAVISRSWLLAQLDKRDELQRLAAAGKCDEGRSRSAAGDCAESQSHSAVGDCAEGQSFSAAGKGAGVYSSVECDTPGELIRWQDREDHKWFDFCADDHCQRYQGIPQGNPAMVRKTKRVIEATWGQVLSYGGRVCDARFSKCCGGALEEFKYCWENKEVPYLKYARDYASGRDCDLTREVNARRWILSSPRAFCNRRSARLLGQVLKDYDSETKDFYRWTVEYQAEELRQIILERTGEDYGEIRDLIPLERGVSGRICRLKIVGSKKTKIIGKELEIRKTLSRSHLYSSAFVVEKTPGGFVLHGAGWGHGVGLCQIGAAAMGARGYEYRAILQHYYPGSTISTLYGKE